MKWVERLTEAGFIEMSKEGELDLSSHTKLLLVKEFSETNDLDGSILSVLERSLHSKLSIDETEEIMDLVRPLANKVII